MLRRRLRMLQLKEFGNFQVETVRQLFGTRGDRGMDCSRLSTRVFTFRTVKVEKVRRIVTQQFGLSLRRKLAVADECSYVLLAERKRLIGAKHYPVGSHCFHQELQGSLPKNCRIHIEATAVSAPSDH